MTRLALSARETAQLQQLANAPGRQAVRAQIILMYAAGGMSGRQVAATLGVGYSTVVVWWRRYVEGGLAGLEDRPKSGRPRKVTGAEVDEHLGETVPYGRRCAAVQNVAHELGVSRSTIYRRRWGVVAQGSEK